MFVLERETYAPESDTDKLPCVELLRHADLNTILCELESAIKADPKADYYVSEIHLVERKRTLADDDFEAFIAVDHQVRYELKRGAK